MQINESLVELCKPGNKLYCKTNTEQFHRSGGSRGNILYNSVKRKITFHSGKKTALSKLRRLITDQAVRRFSGMPGPWPYTERSGRCDIARRCRRKRPANSYDNFWLEMKNSGKIQEERHLAGSGSAYESK